MFSWQKYLNVIKWIVLIFLYVIDFLVIRILEITLISIGFIIEYVIFFGIIFSVRKLFKYLKKKIGVMEQKLSAK